MTAEMLAERQRPQTAATRWTQEPPGRARRQPNVSVSGARRWRWLSPACQHVIVPSATKTSTKPWRRGCGGISLIDFRVIGRGVRQLEVSRVGDVVGEHVEDEALLDGLAHRVEVERSVQPVEGPLVPNDSRVLAFGVAVKAKNDKFDCLPRAASEAASTSRARPQPRS